MNKAELVKIISKKAAVSETSSKELFHFFLRKIADELQPGDSAQFSNVGYFYLRKGKIKKEGKDAEGEKVEYLDLIIFSSESQFNIKSPDNLVFSVPELKDTEQDNLDAHFSLSAGKPVLADLDSKSTFVSDSHEFDTDKKFILSARTSFSSKLTSFSFLPLLTLTLNITFWSSTCPALLAFEFFTSILLTSISKTSSLSNIR